MIAEFLIYLELLTVLVIVVGVVGGIAHSAVRSLFGAINLRIKLRRQRKVRAEIIEFEQHRARMLRAVAMEGMRR